MTKTHKTTLCKLVHRKWRIYNTPIDPDMFFSLIATSKAPCSIYTSLNFDDPVVHYLIDNQLAAHVGHYLKDTTTSTPAINKLIDFHQAIYIQISAYLEIMIKLLNILQV